MRHGSQFALSVASELGCSPWHVSLQGCAWPSGLPPGRDPGGKACGKLSTCPELCISHLTSFGLGPSFSGFTVPEYLSNNPDIHCGSAISHTKKPSPCPAAPPVTRQTESLLSPNAHSSFPGRGPRGLGGGPQHSFFGAEEKQPYMLRVGSEGLSLL